MPFCSAVTESRRVEWVRTASPGALDWAKGFNREVDVDKMIAFLQRVEGLAVQKCVFQRLNVIC